MRRERGKSYGTRLYLRRENNHMRLPSQDLADIVRLTFTDCDLQSVAESDTPPLAAQCRHFTDVVHVHNRIAVNSLKLRRTQPALDGTQRLSCQKALLGGYDPDQFPIRLEGEDFVYVQKVIFLADPADYSSAHD